MVDAVYYSGVAITVLILNALSFVSLTFVIVIYIIRWKHIASFPMRLVCMDNMLVFLPVYIVHHSKSIRHYLPSRVCEC